MSEAEIDAIVAFLEHLTDERVLYARARFDHPQLCVPNGYLEGGEGEEAVDEFIVIRAVGADGGPALPGFLEGRLPAGRLSDCD